MPVVPATQEAEAGGSLEPRSLRLLPPRHSISFLGDFLPARLRCRGYRTVVPASQPVDTAVGAEETGPAAGHISCFILKGSIRNEEKEVISGLLLFFIFKMFIIKKFSSSPKM
uniref:Uncharacterized protein n=1 Tax=Propithecus coquereli TaxID=379532 RepID=A0A2K6F582_PROCO